MEEAFALRQSMKDSQVSEKTKLNFQKRVKLVYERVENLHEEAQYSSHLQSSSSSISDSEDEEEDKQEDSSLEIEELDIDDTHRHSKQLTDAKEAQLQEENNFDDQLHTSQLKSITSIKHNDQPNQHHDNQVIPFTPQITQQEKSIPPIIQITSLMNQQNQEPLDAQVKNSKNQLELFSKNSEDIIEPTKNQNQQPDIESINKQIQQQEEDTQNNIQNIQAQSSIQKKEDFKDEASLSDRIKNPSQNIKSIQLEPFQSVRIKNSTPQIVAVDKEENKTNQNVSGTEISIGKQIFVPSLGNETVISQTNKNQKWNNLFQQINQMDISKDQKADLSGLNLTNQQDDSFSKLVRQPSSQFLKRGASQETIFAAKIQRSPLDNKVNSDITMNNTMSRIANLMRQKTLKGKLKQEEQPHERTAQTILKTRNLPKKNVTKEAKIMLNSLSNSLRKNANNVMLIGSQANSLSPHKTNQPMNMFFGTPTQNGQQSLLQGGNSQLGIPQLHQTQQDQDPQSGINQILVEFLKKQIIGNNMSTIEKQEPGPTVLNSQIGAIDNQIQQVTLMTDGQKINMMLGLLIKIQKDQEELKREVKFMKLSQFMNDKSVVASAENHLIQQDIQSQQFQMNQMLKPISNAPNKDDKASPTQEQESSLQIKGVNQPMASITEQHSSDMASSKDNPINIGCQSALTQQLSQIQKQDGMPSEQDHPLESVSTNKIITTRTQRKMNSAAIKNEKDDKVGGVLDLKDKKSKETSYSSIVVASSHSSKLPNQT